MLAIIITTIPSKFICDLCIRNIQEISNNYFALGVFLKFLQ